MLDQMRLLVRGMFMLPVLVLLFGLLLVVIQFTFRAVQYLSNTLFSAPWG